MIIPPDPEKDPNLFTPADSTPSLLLPTLDGDIRAPDPAHPHSRQAYAYAYGEWSGEQLPPYEGKRASREGDVFSDRQEMTERSASMPRTRSQAGLNPLLRNSRAVGLAPLDTSLPIASSSTQSLPSPATTLDGNASTSKLWESSTSPLVSKEGRRNKLKAAFTPAPEIRDWWAQYRKWVIAIVITILIGLGIMTGLLVGLRVGVDKGPPSPADNFSPWHDIDGKKTNTQWAPDGSLNMTYTENRDGPNPNEGNQSQINQFTLVNTTDFSYLSIPYPAQTLYVSTFTFPLSNSSNNDSYINDLFITARGLGSSGTIEFIGADYPGPIIQGGEDNDFKVDVVLRYGGDQDVMDTVHVCKLEREDGSAGIGIYTPTETDGKVTNVYMLDPTSLPSFQIVVRLPPAAIAKQTENPIWLNSLNINVDRMNVIWGDLEGILEMGSFTFNTGRGSFNAGHLTAQKATVLSAYNDVAGTFNISESLLVNVSDGSITAHVFLHNDAQSKLNEIVGSLDTSGVNYPSSTSAKAAATSDSAPESSSPVRRSTLAIPTPNSTAASLDEVLFNASVNSTPIAAINTTFQTTSGSISITYLSHPPRTALTSLVVSAEGGLNVNMHPAYVGPFAVRNVWGEVRLPQFDNHEMTDPLDSGRMRGMSLGPINVPINSLFADGGVNTTNLPYSGTTITGAAYWYYEPNTTSTSTTSYTTQADDADGDANSGEADSDPNGYPQRHKSYQPSWGQIYDSAPLSAASNSLWPISPIPPIKIQSSPEGRDSQLMVLGAYGDVRVTFDGT